MFLYTALKQRFLTDVKLGLIADRVEEEYIRATGENPSRSERRSWENSLPFMAAVLDDASIPDDVGIAVEYGLPFSSRRVDVMVTGMTEYGRHSAVLIELKQWTHAGIAKGGNGMVTTFLGGKARRALHPSYQISMYADYLKCTLQNVRNGDIAISGCAYLHNYNPYVQHNGQIASETYGKYMRCSPLFFRGGAPGVRSFINANIAKGDGLDTVRILDRCAIDPSVAIRRSAEALVSKDYRLALPAEGEEELENALFEVTASMGGAGKHAVVVGAGREKTVLAVNLMACLLQRGYSSAYVTDFASPRDVYKSALKCNGRRRYTSVLYDDSQNAGRMMPRCLFEVLFKNVGTFSKGNCRREAFDVLIVDTDAIPDNQSDVVPRILGSAKVLVFILDVDSETSPEFSEWSADNGWFVKSKCLTERSSNQRIDSVGQIVYFTQVSNQANVPATFLK